MAERILIRDGDGAVFAWTEALSKHTDLKEGVLEKPRNWRLENLAKAQAKQRALKAQKAVEPIAAPVPIPAPQPISDKT